MRSGGLRASHDEKGDAEVVLGRLGEKILRYVDGRVLDEVELVVSYWCISVEVASRIVVRTRMKLTVGPDRVVLVLKCTETMAFMAAGVPFSVTGPFVEPGA
jgi:hypothetical protein